MQHLDLLVLEQALDWAAQDRSLWLCTVISTFGSAPRSPGAMLVVDETGASVGSLSGGCVEEEFFASLAGGHFRQAAQVISYGTSTEERQRLQLPCGGSLEVLVEFREPSPQWKIHLQVLLDVLRGQRRILRRVSLSDGSFSLCSEEACTSNVRHERNHVQIGIGPALRVLLAGLSPVAQACGQFAKALGCEVVVCDPREEVRDLAIDGVELLPILPSLFIANGGCHAATAVVALTHDPKIDDLTLMEAVNTQAFYIGAMGSRRTSEKRAERLARIGELSAEQIARLHMPIGLDLGSRTPTEIALAVMADVLRVYRGKDRAAL
ncbi:XshC-Cox1 family protein [Pseudomonas frederiksbergensis]|uniref:XshC-Cox1 family protein n=1 Tax=Pseudomonas frederiksbergensis TaxID=104087 RepID=A0A1J0ESQ2_9PSED|nr:XdhC family protein [Pseudomonas frederiksbergensis]APC18812.1 XshC-Cox1 family protein [Pseudomonas frederiksbergensis]